MTTPEFEEKAKVGDTRHDDKKGEMRPDDDDKKAKLSATQSEEERTGRTACVYRYADMCVGTRIDKRQVCTASFCGTARDGSIADMSGSSPYTWFPCSSLYTAR